MALAVAAGLIFGTIITLLMLPSALYVVSDLRVLKNRFAHKYLGRELLERAEMEPARNKD
jgi:hypothetical protein